MSRFLSVCIAAARVLLAYRSGTQSWMIALFEEAQKLGGVYVKFLQQLAGIELVSSQFVAYKGHLKVFDEVQTEPLNITAVVQSELGVEASRLYDIESEPLATGSFAQVYRAKLTGGSQQVVIKVLRPSLQRHLRADLRLLRVLARLVQPLVKGGLLDLPAMAREFQRSSLQETDYVREAAMGQYLHEYYAGRSDKIVIPLTYDELSTKNVLVQEYVDGLPLSDVIQQAHSGVDTYEYVEAKTGSSLRTQLVTVGSEFLTSILQADFVMADPHAGNILLLADDKVALIDFGLVAKAPLHRSAFFGMITQYRALYENRVDMGALAIAMMAFYDYELYEALRTVQTHGSITDNLGHYISDKVATPDVLAGRLARRRNISQLFLQQLNAGNRFAIRIDERDAILQKAMHNFLSTARLSVGEAHRDTRYFDVMHAALVLAEQEAYRLGVQEADVAHGPMGIETAQEIVVDWLSTVAERDRAAYQTLMQGGVR